MKKILIVAAATILLTACNKTNPLQETVQKAKQKVTQNQQMICTYEMDGEEIKSYMKKGKVRTEMGDFITISDGEYIWSWSEKERTGTKMSVREPDEDEQPGKMEMPTKEEMQDINEMMKKMQEEMKASCKPASISDDKFVPPSDVTFTDMDEQMKKMEEYSKKYEDMGEEEMDSEQMEQMMKEAGEMMKNMEGM